MAQVQLADIYNPLTFARRTQEAQTEKNAFLASGIAVEDGFLQSQVNQGGNIGELANYNPLSTGEPTYSSDNPADTLTPEKIASQTQVFRVAHRNNAWSTMDFARELALEDAAGAITGRIGTYWATDNQKRIINTYLGVLADNVANDAGDMVIDVATDAAGAVTDAERIGGERVIDAMDTVGDSKNILTTLAIHSKIHTRLQKQQLIDYIRDADNNIMFETYMGRRLIVDDGLPAVAGANRITYTCMMFATGVISHANGRVLTPFEIEREALVGGGSGQDIMVSRVADVWHPIGFTFTNNTLTGGNTNVHADYGDLQLAANWDRVYERKNVPVAFIQVND